MTQAPVTGPGRGQTIKLMARAASAALLPRLPAYLIHFVTHRCNGRCPFCFVPRADPAPADHELSVAEIEKTADRWPGLLHVTLTGGEPFLREDLPDLVRAWVRAGIMSLTINSNGSLPDRIIPAVEQLLARHPDLFLDLDLSLDAAPLLHDRLRGIPGAHDKALAAATALAPLQARRRGFRLGATVTLSACNSAEAEDTVRELSGRALFRRIQVLWVRGQTADPAAGRADLQIYDRCAAALQPAPGGSTLRNTLARLVRERVRLAALGRPAERPCLAARTMVTLDPAGRILPCEMLPQLLPGGAPENDFDWTLGSLRDHDYDISSIMSGRPSSAIRAWIIRPPFCTCSFECAAYNSLVFDPRNWPRVLAAFLKTPRI